MPRRFSLAFLACFLVANANAVPQDPNPTAMMINEEEVNALMNETMINEEDINEESLFSTLLSTLANFLPAVANPLIASSIPSSMRVVGPQEGSENTCLGFGEAAEEEARLARIRESVDEKATDQEGADESDVMANDEDNENDDAIAGAESADEDAIDEDASNKDLTDLFGRVHGHFPRVPHGHIPHIHVPGAESADEDAIDEDAIDEDASNKDLTDLFARRVFRRPHGHFPHIHAHGHFPHIHKPCICSASIDYKLNYLNLRGINGVRLGKVSLSSAASYPQCASWCMTSASCSQCNLIPGMLYKFPSGQCYRATDNCYGCVSSGASNPTAGIGSSLKPTSCSEGLSLGSKPLNFAMHLVVPILFTKSISVKGRGNAKACACGMCPHVGTSATAGANIGKSIIQASISGKLTGSCYKVTVKNVKVTLGSVSVNPPSISALPSILNKAIGGLTAFITNTHVRGKIHKLAQSKIDGVNFESIIKKAIAKVPGGIVCS